MKKFKFLETEDLVYLKSLKKELIFSAIIFILFSFAGFFSAGIYSRGIVEIIDSLKELASKSSELNNYQLFGLIFFNNAFKTVLVLLLGVLLGIVPLLFLTVNSFIVGLVAQITKQTIGWTSFWVGILPHGILEIPVLIIGSAIGFKFGDIVFQRFIKKQRQWKLKNEFSKAVLFSVKVLVPILFFTAFLEVFVTKSLINL